MHMLRTHQWLVYEESSSVMRLVSSRVSDLWISCTLLQLTQLISSDPGLYPKDQLAAPWLPFFDSQLPSFFVWRIGGTADTLLLTPKQRLYKSQVGKRAANHYHRETDVYPSSLLAFINQTHVLGEISLKSFFQTIDRRDTPFQQHHIHGGLRQEVNNLSRNAICFWILWFVIVPTRLGKLDRCKF